MTKNTFKNTPENEELVLAHLAIHLGKKSDSAIGAIPDDEELAAFADQSLNDATRRAQILSHIASNHQVYHRWIQLVEAISQLDSNTQSVAAKQESPGKQKQGLWGWLFGTNLRAGVFGAGMATAAVVMVAVILLPVTGKLVSLDDQYDQMIPIINGQWDSIPHEKKPFTTSSDTRSFQFLSATQSVVEYGFHRNALTIGKSRYEALGIAINEKIELPEKPDNLTAEQYRELQNLGKLVALTTIQCELKITDKSFESSYQSAKDTLAKLQNIQDSDLDKLANSLDSSRSSKSSNKKQAVCGLSDRVLAILF